MIFTVLALLLGLAIMVKGADLFVDHASIFGKSLRLPPVLIGIFVVAVGTSLPELVVSVIASIQGHPEIAAGNIIGSNITNIGLIISLAAILGSVKLSKKTVDFDIPLSILPLGILVFGYILNVVLAQYLGVLLLLTYVGYLAFDAREYATQMAIGDKKGTRISVHNFLLLVFGLLLLIAGGEIALRYATEIAQVFDLSDVFIGAIVLALGTSLPELVVTITAVLRKEGELALGNVLGSNVFNMLAVLGVSSIIHEISIDHLLYEIVFLGIMSFAFLFVSKTGRKYEISRLEGVLLLAIYVVYVITLVNLS